jgi:hypothetical protein
MYRLHSDAHGQAIKPRRTESAAQVQYKNSSNPPLTIRPNCKLRIHFLNSISTFTDWAQLQKYVFPKISYYRDQEPTLPDQTSIEGNIFLADPDPAEGIDVTGTGVLNYLRNCLDLPIHSVTSEVSTLNTFSYLYHTMRCGIFVMIRRGRLVIFCPFVNKDYSNTWAGRLKISGSGSIEDYYLKKNSGENYLFDMSKWWANGQ